LEKLSKIIKFILKFRTINYRKLVPEDFYTTMQELYKEMRRRITPEDKLNSIPSAQLADEIVKRSNNQNQNFKLEYQVDC
jgi:hypothetical protein